MLEEEIIERNKDISLMLGGKFVKSKGRWNLDIFPDVKSDYDLKFHKDWNWLMESVNFVEKLYYDFHGYIGVHITSNSCTLQGTKLRLSPDNYHPALFMQFYGIDKKEATFIALSEFAKKYNIGGI
jgi:hypothetical protein